MDFLYRTTPFYLFKHLRNYGRLACSSRSAFAPEPGLADDISRIKCFQHLVIKLLMFILSRTSGNKIENYVFFNVITVCPAPSIGNTGGDLLLPSKSYTGGLKMRQIYRLFEKSGASLGQLLRTPDTCET